MNTSDNSTCILTKKQYGVVDLMRMFMAFCVLFIHRGYVMNNETLHFFIRGTVCELAVPFFACATAFFLYRKINNTDTADRDAVYKKYIKRMLRLLLLWYLIYTPDMLYRYWFVQKEPLAEVLKKYVYEFFLGGQTNLHLWYIQALIVMTAVLFILQKKFSDKLLFIVFYLLYVIYIFADNSSLFEEIYNKVPDAIINYFFKILVFFMLGKIIAKHNSFETDFKGSLTGLIISVSVSVILFVMRFRYEKIGAVLQLSVLPIVIFYLFRVCIGVNFSFKNQKNFRSFTELFFFTHMIIPVEIYSQLCDMVGRPAMANNFLIIMTFYTVVTVVISFIILKLSETKVFAFLKYLY